MNNFKVGDEVYELNDWFANGAQAEYCVASATALALVPESLDHVQSAVVPISALTAWPGRVYLNERICRRVSGFLFTEQPAAWELLPYNSLTGAAHESSPDEDCCSVCRFCADALQALCPLAASA